MWQVLKGFMGGAAKAVTGFAYWKWVGIAAIAVVILVIAATAWSRGVRLEKAALEVTQLKSDVATLQATLADDRKTQNDNYAVLEKALALSGEAVDSCLEHVRVTERDKAALRRMNQALQERLDERATAKLREQQTLFMGACSAWAGVAVCDDADRILQQSTSAGGAWSSEGGHGSLGPSDRAGTLAEGAHGPRGHATTAEPLARMRASPVYWAAGDVVGGHGISVATGESHARLYRSVGSVARR